MEQIFQFDNVNNNLVINVPEILLVKEFAALWSNDRNITKSDKKGDKKERAYKEFAYIALAIAWGSPYANDPEQDKHESAMLDSGLTEEEFNDPLFRAACRRFIQIQESIRSMRLLRAAQATVDKFIDYFNNVDPEERDPQTGKPIFKVKELIAEISSLSKVHEELKKLEGDVKQELAPDSALRGGATDGYQPTF